MAKITNIDNRNKTIEKPFVYKNTTFGNFLCQYSVFENEVRFENCIFNDNVIFGDEFKDQAFCLIKSDLIFDGCTFLNIVNLDGLQCYGHVIFKNCMSSYNSTPSEPYSISMSNSYVVVGVEFAYCHINGGINLSAIHIERVGCFFDHVIINNRFAQLNYDSGYFGKQLIFKACSIDCQKLSFINSSVDKDFGNISWVGPFSGNITNEDIINHIIESKWSMATVDFSEIVSCFEIWHNGYRHLVIIHDNEVPLSLLNLQFGSIEKNFDVLSKRYNSRIHFIVDSELDSFLERNNINEDYLLPVGSASYSNIDEGFISVVYFNGTYHLSMYNAETHDIKEQLHVDVSELGQYIFGNDLVTDSITTGYHNGVKKIEGKNNNEIRHFAIFCNPINRIKKDNEDGSFLFKESHYRLYEWNYFNVKEAIDLSACHVGSNLYIGQSEFSTPVFSLYNIEAKNIIKMIDVKLNTSSLLSDFITCKNYVLQNIDLLVSEKWDAQRYIPVQSKENERGIFLNNSNITDNFEITDLLIHHEKEEQKKAKSYIQANYMEVGKECSFARISFRGNDGCKESILCLNGFTTKQLCLNAMNWKNISLEAEDMHFDNIKIDKAIPDFDFVKNMIDAGIIKNKGKIQFLRQIESVLSDKYDQEKNARKFWRYRYKLRIQQEHHKTYRFVNFFYHYILDYGLSSNRLLTALVLIMFAFDLYVACTFNTSLISSFINGLVIFCPVNFDQNVIDPIIIPKPQMFIYSAMAVLYRILSYIILAVLIASYGGFFKGRYK